MKTSIFFSAIFLITLQHSANAQRPSPSRHIKQFIDPVKKHLWSKTDFNLFSKESINAERLRYCVNINILKQGIKEEDFYEMRLSLRTGLREFPIKSEAYLLINNHVYPLELKEVNSDNYFIIKNEDTADSNGQIIQNVKTSEFQLFNKSCDITEIMNDVLTFKKASLILYTGNMPIEFEIESYNLNKLNLILEY